MFKEKPAFAPWDSRSLIIRKALAREKRKPSSRQIVYCFQRFWSSSIPRPSRNPRRDRGSRKVLSLLASVMLQSRLCREQDYKVIRSQPRDGRSHLTVWLQFLPEKNYSTHILDRFLRQCHFKIPSTGLGYGVAMDTRPSCRDVKIPTFDNRKWATLTRDLSA
jgi:hypothetical protein